MDVETQGGTAPSTLLCLTAVPELSRSGDSPNHDGRTIQGASGTDLPLSGRKLHPAVTTD